MLVVRRAPRFDEAVEFALRESEDPALSHRTAAALPVPGCDLRDRTRSRLAIGSIRAKPVHGGLHHVYSRAG